MKFSKRGASHIDTHPNDPRLESRLIKGVVNVAGQIDAIPPALISELKLNNETTDRREDKRLWLEKATFISVIFLALLSLIQTYLSTRATKATEASLNNSVQSFRIDERAWVVLEITPIETSPPVGPFPARILYGFYAKNVGKTIARDVHVHLDGLTNAKGGDALLGPETVAPGELSIAASAMTAGDVFLTTYKGRIDYRDAFGFSHWRKFCYRVVNRKGTLEQCEDGNEDDTQME